MKDLLLISHHTGPLDGPLTCTISGTSTSTSILADWPTITCTISGTSTPTSILAIWLTFSRAVGKEVGPLWQGHLRCYCYYYYIEWYSCQMFNCMGEFLALVECWNVKESHPDQYGTNTKYFLSV